MRALILALSLIAATPATAMTEAFRGDLLKVIDLAVAPQAVDGKEIRLPCLMTIANLTFAICPVFNSAGQSVGNYTLSLAAADADSRKRAANECTGNKMPPRCAAYVSGRAKVLGTSINIEVQKVEWLEP